MARKKSTQSSKSTAVAKRDNADRQEPTQHRTQVLAEIVAIAEGLEDDGLELLLQQAKVVEYKGKIERFNRRLNVAAHEAIEARRAAGRPNYHVSVERTEDDFFIIQLDDVRVFFNIGEMRELTRICHKAADASAAARRLFQWFEEERSDLLADAGINSTRSPYLAGIYDIIVTTYKVRD